jgi:hypothetical protein
MNSHSFVIGILLEGVALSKAYLTYCFPHKHTYYYVWSSLPIIEFWDLKSQIQTHWYDDTRQWNSKKMPVGLKEKRESNFALENNIIISIKIV